MGFRDWFGRGSDRSVSVSPQALFEEGAIVRLDSSKVSPIVAAAIDRIVSRGSQALFTCTANPGIEQIVQRPSGQSSNDFYASVITELLTYGIAFLYQESEDEWRVGYTPDCDIVHPQTPVIGGNGGYRLRIQTDRNSTTGQREFMGGGRNAFVITLRPQASRTPYIPSTPLKDLAPVVKAYEGAFYMLIDYADKACNVGAALQAGPEVTNQEQQDEVIADLKRQFDSVKSRFSRVFIPPHVKFEPVPTPDAPALDAIEQGLAVVSAYYGVPKELLSASQARQEAASTEAHLLADGVAPVLDRIAAAWTQHLGGRINGGEVVAWDRLSVLRSGLGSMAKLVTGLAQSGVMSTDELRQALDLDEVGGEWGDNPPQAAGAPSREEDAGDSGDQPEQSE